MELELGLKITRTREDVSSSVDFRFSKDPFGPLVLSRETDSRFIIIIHLKGFKKEGIEIEINNEGNRITIRGRKAVEEMVLIRWMAWRKEVELRVFKKVFLIPDIVDLDKIKARFDDDDSTLTITMPKRVKGISGFKIEEEEEEEERVDFGDVSEVENREEIQNVEEFEEEDVEREKSDEHSERFETEIQRGEEFGEIIMEDKERESQVLGEEEETEDDNLEKIHQIDEQDKILEFIEEEQIGQQELADSNKDSEDSSLRKLPDIEEEEVMEKQVSEVDDFGSRAFEELGKTKAQEFESGKLEADEVKKIHELVEKKEEEDGNAKVGEPVQEIEDTLERCEGKHKIEKRFQEEADNEREEHKEKKINGSGAREVQEIIRQQELDEPARCEKESKTRELVKSKTNDANRETAETKTKEQESHRPKILGEQEKIQELAEDKTNFSRKGEVEEEIAEKQAEFCEVSRKDSDQEEKDKIQELVREEKVGDRGKGIIAVAETKAEIDKSRKVEEIDEQQSEQVDKRGRREVNHEKSEKKTIETDKGIRNSATDAQEIEKKDSDVSGKHGKEDMVRNEHEDEEKEKADKPQKKTGTTEQELVNLKSQLDQDNIHEEREKSTQELREEKAKDCQEDESETKTDDVIRKVQGIKEEELYEPKREHVSKITQLVEEKIAESQIEAERGGLSNEHELHEPKKIHKERGKTTPLTGAEEPSGQEKKEDEEGKIVESETITETDNNSIDVQEMKEGRPEKPESHEKQYKIQQVVKAGHNGHKEEQGEEKVISKQETEEDSSKKVLQDQIEKQESDELKRSMVQDKIEKTEEKDKPRAMEENENVERRTKTKDGSSKKVRYDEDPELRKPHRRQEEDKVQELVEMETSDYREKVKKQDEDYILRSQEAGKPELDESERDGEKSNIPQLVEEEKVEDIAELGGRLEDDSSGKFHEFEERKSYEHWTHEEREKRIYFVKEKATGPKDKHTGGQVHEDHKEEQKEANVITKAELKTEEDSSKNVLQDIEKQEYDELHRSMVQDKMQKTEEKDKGRAMEENEILKRGTKTKDGEDPELGELERHCKQRKIQQQSVEDEKGEGNKENISEPSGKMDGDSSSKFHEFQKQKSYQDWRQEESEEIRNLVEEEATDYPKDNHIGEEEEEERFEKVSQAKTKVEDEINKNAAGNYKEPESEKQERFGKLDKLKGLLGNGASEHDKEEETIMGDFTTKIQDTEKEESREADRQKKLDIVKDFEEVETRNQEDEKPEEAVAVMANDEKDSSRKFQTIKEKELKEPEEHKVQNKIPETSDPEVKKEDEERVSEREIKEQEAHVQELEGKTENCKDEDRISRKIREAKVQESSKNKDHEPEDKIEELERQNPVKLVTEDDRLRKGQEFLKKESPNVSKRRPVEQEKFQALKEMEKREDGEKAEAETKIDNGNSRKFETSKMLELDESEENEEQKEIHKPMEEKNKVLDEKNEDIAEEKIQDKIESRNKDQEIKGQEPYELHKNGEHEKIPEPIVEKTKYHREEEKGMEERETEEIKRPPKNVSSRKSHQIEDELEKHQEPSEIQESVEQTIEEHGYKEPSKTKSMEDLRQNQDVEEKRSDQEHGNIQEPMIEEEGIEKGEKKEKTERIPQVKPKANDDSSRKNEFEEQESTRLREQKKRVKHEEMVERETNDQSKEEKTEADYDRSRKVQDNEEEKSDKLEKLGETSNRREGKERNRAVWREGETKTRDDGCRKVKEIQEQELGVTHKEDKKKQALVKKDIAGQAKEKKDQETKYTDDSSRNVKEYEKQESEEQEVEESGKGDKETADANGSRKLKEIESESTEVEKHENPDIIQEFWEDNMIKQEEEEENESIKAKPEDHESKRHVGLKEQDKTREPVQQKTDNRKDEETAKTETKTKDNEPSKMQEMKEQETSEQRRLEEQERVKKLVDELEDSSNMKKIQEIEKEESIEQGRDEILEKIQEPVVMETSVDDEEEELEIEFEDSEEDWEAEVIREMGSDEENGKIRQIKRIKLGFRLVGGSALFMSLIVIVISFIRSKKKIRSYKF